MTIEELKDEIETLEEAYGGNLFTYEDDDFYRIMIDWAYQPDVAADDIVPPWFGQKVAELQEKYLRPAAIAA